ncbi:hypothetical protein NNJEOMEG_02661 [Fundidesulfovibrio magnetotacticus]|uniref:Uncharacterized protein n=1 Tax=Fundidesulfovibrio magnetotacticus TaxID=2730080 RepID=A0A6V8LQP2_9BACT|nr:hypothetical protein [Fundidesulfovibrio magnetotacticus]GFK94813.1 hypothetical protein NNJEOMEG_02661 [Fundidesulfovibrio magnetotacticus]
MTIPRRLPLVLSCVLAGALLWPGAALANIGVPMILLTLPGMVLTLIPVVLLEVWVLAGRLTLPARTAFRVSAWANAATTFVGVPVTWFLLYLLEMFTGGGQAYGIETPLQKFLAVTWQAPWLIPYEMDGNLRWMVPTAAMWLLVPSFFTSWWLETRVARRLLKDADPARLSAAMLRANLLSYVFLELLAVAWLVYSVHFDR